MPSRCLTAVRFGGNSKLIGMAAGDAMQLNSVLSGALTGVFIALVLALGLFWLSWENPSEMPPTIAESYPSEEIIPPEPEPTPATSELARRNYQSRVAALLGDTGPGHDFSGDVEAAAVADRERALARIWCASHVAKHLNLSERDAAELISQAERGDLISGARVLDALEVEDPGVEDRVRVVQCAAILYLGFDAST